MPLPRAPLPPGQPGFSLIELLATLVLLGILAGLAAPSLRAVLAGIRSRSALEQFVTDLAYARMLAVRDGERVEVRLALDTRQSCVVAYGVVETGAAERVARRVALDVPRVCLATNNSNPIIFNTRGLPHGVFARSVWVSWHGRADSLRISQLGRVYRAY